MTDLRGFSQTAVVYTTDADGAYMVVDNAALPCRLLFMQAARDAQPSNVSERQELAAARRLLWGPDYAMPERNVQVEIDGERWNPVYGTVQKAMGRFADIAFQRVDVVREQS